VEKYGPVIPRRVEYLLALIREGHFARAAAACHVSQPTLSAGIQQLEQDFGVTIVKRGRRFEGLTAEGALVFEWAQRAVVESQRLARALRDRSGQLAGTLRIGYIASIAPFVTPLTMLFGVRYPEIALRVTRYQNALAIQQGLNEFSIDVGLTYIEQKPHVSKTQTIDFYPERYQLVARKGNSLLDKKEVTWDELWDADLCVFTPESELLGTVENDLLWGGKHQGRRIETDSINFIMEYIRTGEWVSVLPRAIMVVVARDPRLGAVPLAHSGPPWRFGVVIPPRQPASPLAKAFLEVASSPKYLATLEEALPGWRKEKAYRGTPLKHPKVSI
jgi:DNA-binding transcriptional LysR family regulator